MVPRLVRQGGVLEVRARRAGLRTAVMLLEDGTPVGEGTGLGRVLMDLPGDPAAGRVLVLAPLPGVVARAVLLVPRDGDGELDVLTAERHPFEPAPGTLAARVREVEERHPRLWAARHVVLAVGRVLAGLLGLAALLQLLVRPVLAWLAGLLPRVDLPSLPLPDIDLPGIPWPDLDLPDLTPPGWLVAVLASAKFWGPVLVAVVLAVLEVRRKRRAARGSAGDRAGAAAGEDPPRADRRP